MKYHVKQPFTLKGREMKPGMTIDPEGMPVFAGVDFQPLIDGGKVIPELPAGAIVEGDDGEPIAVAAEDGQADDEAEDRPSSRSRRSRRNR